MIVRLLVPRSAQSDHRARIHCVRRAAPPRLTFVLPPDAHDDAGNTHQGELWYLRAMLKLSRFGTENNTVRTHAATVCAEENRMQSDATAFVIGKNSSLPRF